MPIRPIMSHMLAVTTGYQNMTSSRKPEVFNVRGPGGQGHNAPPYTRRLGRCTVGNNSYITATNVAYRRYWPIAGPVWPAVTWWNDDRPRNRLPRLYTAVIIIAIFSDALCLKIASNEWRSTYANYAAWPWIDSLATRVGPRIALAYYRPRCRCNDGEILYLCPVWHSTIVNWAHSMVL